MTTACVICLLFSADINPSSTTVYFWKRTAKRSWRLLTCTFSDRCHHQAEDDILERVASLLSLSPLSAFDQVLRRAGDQVSWANEVESVRESIISACPEGSYLIHDMKMLVVLLKHLSSGRGSECCTCISTTWASMHGGFIFFAKAQGQWTGYKFGLPSPCGKSTSCFLCLNGWETRVRERRVSKYSMWTALFLVMLRKMK